MSSTNETAETAETAEAARELKLVRNALDKSAIVAVTDLTGAIIHVNDKFCEISKYSREELLGKNHRVINSGHHHPEFFIEMWKTISSGKNWEGEIKNRAKDGTFYWVNTTIVPFLNDKGMPYEYVSIRYEVTQRKNAEEQLRIYADRLEQSNRELQDFASVAAHDLQEPLRKILAFGDRLNTRFAADLQPEAKDFLERMLTSAKRMRTLIDDLLTFSRVTTKGSPFEKTNLNKVVKEVLSDLEFRIEQVKGKIEVKELPTLVVDPLQIRQLFQNLISNALKFHQAGVSPVVKISAECDHIQCVIKVEDQGIGFEEKYLDKIFTIFQRLHGKHEYEGTGVGLAVCRRIAERHGGSITASGKLNEGATFLVVLPVRR